MTATNASSTVLLVGTNNGLFQARDRGGDLYELSSLGPEGKIVMGFTVDPRDPQRIYAATQNDGMWRTTDRGRSWQEINKGILYKELWSLAQHPTTGDLYAGSQPPSIFKSTDGGDTWTDCRKIRSLEDSLHWTFPPPPHLAHVKHIALSAEDPSLVYGAIEEGWLIRSADGGATWETQKQGVSFDSHSVLLIPGEPSVVLATSGGGVFRSENAGESFKRSDKGIPAGITGGGYMGTAAVHPERPRVIFTGAAELPPPFWFTRSEGAKGFFYRSDDQGKSWSRLEGSEATRAAPRSTFIDPADPDRVFFGMTDGSIWLTPDGGKSLRKVVEGLSGWIAAIHITDARTMPEPT